VWWSHVVDTCSSCASGNHVVPSRNSNCSKSKDVIDDEKHIGLQVLLAYVQGDSRAADSLLTMIKHVRLQRIIYSTLLRKQ